MHRSPAITNLLFLCSRSSYHTVMPTSCENLGLKACRWRSTAPPTPPIGWAAWLVYGTETELPRLIGLGPSRTSIPRDTGLYSGLKGKKLYFRGQHPQASFGYKYHQRFIDPLNKALICIMAGKVTMEIDCYDISCFLVSTRGVSLFYPLFLF